MTGEDGQEMYVGGIPLSKIKELVSEAMSAADHHKKTARASGNMPGGYANSVQSNQQAYGSANSVVWDDDKSALKAKTLNHPQVKQVLSALNDKDVYAKAVELKPVSEPLYVNPNSNSKRSIDAPQNSPPPNNSNRTTLGHGVGGGERIEQQTENEYAGNRQQRQPNTGLSSRGHRLTGLLKKGFFGGLANEIRQKNY